MARIMLAIGDAAEVLDTFYPLFRLQEEGYEVVVAGPERRRYHLVLHERPPGWDITQERPGYTLEAQACFAELRVEDLGGAVLTGGRAPEYLRYDADLIRLVRGLYAVGKPIAAICHGIEILAAADIIRGREVTTVPKCRYDCELSGGIYVDQPVVISGSIVTARTWQDNAAWMRAFIPMLRCALGR